VVTSPGRLYGIRVDRLGREGTTSARNRRLIELCRYARAFDGARVVETLATGIPRVVRSVGLAGLPAPRFTDTGISFSAVLPGPAADPLGGVGLDGSAVSTLSPGQSMVLQVLKSESMNVTRLQQSTGLMAPNLRRVLRVLRDAGLVVQDGGQGQSTTYRAL
jgi:ATP-dependent DNA helicase RecG